MGGSHGRSSIFKTGVKRIIETCSFQPSCSCNETPVSGICLDPFGGSGTVGEVCEEEGRNSILIELNPEYVKMANRRTAQLGLFTQ